MQTQYLQQTIFKNQVNHIIKRNQQTLQIHAIGEANPQRIKKILNIIQQGQMLGRTKKEMITSFTEPHQLKKYSAMNYIQKLITQITIQYMDLSLKVNPLTMNQYRLPNGKQIVIFFKQLINATNLQRIDKILDMLKGNEDQYLFYYNKLVSKMIELAKQIIQGMNYCISQQSVFDLLFLQNNYDSSILSARLLTEQNQILIRKKLNLLELLYPKIDVDVIGIKIQHILEHNAKYAEYMLTPEKKQKLFSKMETKQNFNPSKQVLLSYLKGLDMEQYLDMIPQDNQIKGQMQEQILNPYAYQQS